ncbi:MAG: hypothetical protein IRY97_12695, partial [Thermomicrobiaceae bacterium]|nr:hypothetical protein [Thermomicrobiaceae bacterium]
SVSRRPALVPAGRPSRFLAILSERKRAGSWRIEGRIEVASILGSCKLDLRDAEIAGDEVVIDVFILMGSLDLLVPSGIEVELEDVSILASSEDKRRPAEVLPGAPTLRVRGVCVMGSITVKDEERNWLSAAIDVLGAPDRRAARLEGRIERREGRGRDRSFDQ